MSCFRCEIKTIKALHRFEDSVDKNLPPERRLPDEEAANMSASVVTMVAEMDEELAMRVYTLLTEAPWYQKVVKGKAAMRAANLEKMRVPTAPERYTDNLVRQHADEAEALRDNLAAGVE